MQIQKAQYKTRRGIRAWWRKPLPIHPLLDPFYPPPPRNSPSLPTSTRPPGTNLPAPSDARCQDVVWAGQYRPSYKCSLISRCRKNASQHIHPLFLGKALPPTMGLLSSLPAVLLAVIQATSSQSAWASGGGSLPRSTIGSHHQVPPLARLLWPSLAQDLPAQNPHNVGEG